MNKHETNILMLCAFRYALGRRSYIVDDMANLLIKYKSTLNVYTRVLIIKEIKTAFETNNYGMEMDKDIWQIVLDHYEGKIDED
jgi:hypothetical protein